MKLAKYEVIQCKPIRNMASSDGLHVFRPVSSCKDGAGHSQRHPHSVLEVQQSKCLNEEAKPDVIKVFLGNEGFKSRKLFTQ